MREKTLRTPRSVKKRREEVLQMPAAHREDCGEAGCPTAAYEKNHTKPNTHPASPEGHHAVVYVPQRKLHSIDTLCRNILSGRIRNLWERFFKEGLPVGGTPSCNRHSMKGAVWIKCCGLTTTPSPSHCTTQG